MSLGTHPELVDVDDPARSSDDELDPAGPDTEHADGSTRPPIDLVDLLVLLTVAGVGAVAWAALGLAQIGRYSLPAALTAVVVVVVPAALLARRSGLGPWSISWASVGLAGITLVASLAMFLPGAPYTYGDKDPGVYILHGAAIDTNGSIEVPDEVRAADPDTVLLAPGARFPGLWIEGAADEVTPQFYHLYPSLLAVANSLGGLPLSFHVNPVLAALGVTALALAVRRVAGMTAGALTAAFLVTNMLEVWQAKYPTTEIMTQLLVAASLLGVAVAARTRWAPAAAIAGILAGLTFLARPDGLIIVLLGCAAASIVFALNPHDSRVRWFVGGLALTLPHSLINAYDLREIYSRANDLPSLGLALTAISAMAIASAVAVSARHRLRPVHELLQVDNPWWPRLAAPVAIALTVGFLAMVQFFRFRADGGALFFDYNGREIRSFDELNLVRLSFYWPLRAFAISALGLLALGFWQRRPSTWIISLVLLPPVPLYLWAAKNSPRLMWWGRRFVPIALPALVILAAIGAAWLLTRRSWWIRVPMVVLVGSVLVETAAMSLPLRQHREFAGSHDFAEDVAEITGDGVLLWERPVPNDIFALNRNMPSVLWLVHDLPVALLDPSTSSPGVEAASSLRPGAPVYVLVEDGMPPADLAGDLDLVAELTATFPYWEERTRERPDEAVSVTRTLQVFRLDPTREPT